MIQKSSLKIILRNNLITLEARRKKLYQNYAKKWRSRGPMRRLERCFGNWPRAQCREGLYETRYIENHSNDVFPSSASSSRSHHGCCYVDSTAAAANLRSKLECSYHRCYDVDPTSATARLRSKLKCSDGVHNYNCQPKDADIGHGVFHLLGSRIFYHELIS